MKIAFDEHIPAEMVEVFRTLAKKGRVLEHEFLFALDYVRSSDGNDDAPWMRRFANDGGVFVITGDKRIRSRLHQRRAYIECGLGLFMFPSYWDGQKLIVKCAFLMRWWPRIEKHLTVVDLPSCWQMAAAWNGGEFKDVTGPTGTK